MVQESPTPASMISPADSQLTGVDSDDVSFTATHRDSEPASSAHSLLGRRTQLRRNAHPLRYVKRAVMPLNTISSSNSEKRHQHSLDTAELSDLKHINAQYVIACPFLTTLPQTEAYIQSVRVCDSKAITQHLIHILLFFPLAGFNTVIRICLKPRLTILLDYSTHLPLHFHTQDKRFIYLRESFVMHRHVSTNQ